MALQGKKLEINRVISENVAKIMRDMGLNQLQLCEGSKVPTTTLSGNLNNKSFWQIDTLLSISDFSGVDVGVIITGKGLRRIAELERELKTARDYLTILLEEKSAEHKTIQGTIGKDN